MLIKLKANTPGQRGTVLVSKKHLSKEAPFKTLTKPLHSSGGRNNQGRITSRRIGGRVINNPEQLIAIEVSMQKKSSTCFFTLSVSDAGKSILFRTVTISWLLSKAW